ncbi:MAG: LysR family transcriptional regulator [Oscillospiraceae bacterium]|jgi:DNA-binding transcriptional LysR family regulator|nr:LysR family transcriptional regulator [Oscillospiraceae bacterium]
MEMKQLEAFVCVAKNRSFSKAAEEMYASQPSVSAYIGSLEKSLGVQLLTRNTREVCLTKAGQDFLVYAKNILSLRERAIHNITGKGRDADCAIDIISSTIPAQHLLPELIASFQKLYPNVTFSVEQADSRQVEREMRSFRYEFGMIGTVPGGDHFNAYPVYDDELVLVTSRTVQQSAANICDNFKEFITSVPFIMRKPGSGTRVEVEALLSAVGLDLRELRVAAQFSDAHSILLAVSHGLGVSLVSKVAAAMYVDAGLIRAVEMNNPLFRRQIYLIYNKELELSPVQEEFANHVMGFYPAHA